jgi:hypothetical protein
VEEDAAAIVQDGDLTRAGVQDTVDVVRPRHPEDHVDVSVQRQDEGTDGVCVGGADCEGEAALREEGQDLTVGELGSTAALLRKGLDVEVVGDGVGLAHDVQASANVVKSASWSCRGGEASVEDDGREDVGIGKGRGVRRVDAGEGGDGGDRVEPREGGRGRRSWRF